jgi:hypothetical protein
VKQPKTSIIIILICNTLWLGFFLFMIAYRIINGGVWGTSDDFRSFGIEWRISSIFFIILSITLIASIIGLILKRKWVRRINILSMGLALLLPTYFVWMLIDLYKDGMFSDFPYFILLIIAMVTSGILTLIQLYEPKLKEYLKLK